MTLSERSFTTVSPRLTAATPSLSPTAMTMRGLPSNQLATPRHMGFSPLPQALTDTKWANAAQPPLLFGSGSGDAPSIWSTSHDTGLPPTVNGSIGPSKVSSPPFPAHIKSPIASRQLQQNHTNPAFAPFPLDTTFKVDSPSNFVSHGVRSSLSMPPYGFLPQQPPMNHHHHHMSYSQPLQPDPYQGIPSDPFYQPPNRNYRNWAAPP